MKTRRALFWFGSAALGALGGLVLGQVAIGEGFYGKLTGAGEAASFAEYSSNPLAATVDSPAAPLPCRNCPASYAAAAHARAVRLEAKRDEQYQALEPVEIVYPPLVTVQTGMPEEAGAVGGETAGDPSGSPETDTTPAGPRQALAIRHIDDSKLITITPPTARAVPVALPPAP